MDFYEIVTKKYDKPKDGIDYYVYPSFRYDQKDLVAKGGKMYAYWYNNKWNQDYNDLIKIIRKDTYEEYQKQKEKHPDAKISWADANNTDSRIVTKMLAYFKELETDDISFNTKILFASHKMVREDYATYQLSYDPVDSATPAFDELMDKLYEQQELTKILWSIGGILSGETRNYQKMLYLYGPKGTGKSTVIDLIQDMLESYYGTIDLEYLTSGNPFATSIIKELPVLVDGDSKISKIRNGTILMKLIGHDLITVNAKYQDSYDIRFNGMVITASNERYKINGADDGMTRRPLVVHPTGNKHNRKDYDRLVKQVRFEIPAIAHKAMQVFDTLGHGYYDDKIDLDMVAWSDKVFDFVRENAFDLNAMEGITLNRLSEMYKMYLMDLGFDTTGYKKDLRDRISGYFENYYEDTERLGERLRKYYSGFKIGEVYPDMAIKSADQIDFGETDDSGYTELPSLGLDQTEAGVLDTELAEYPAQYSNENGTPSLPWDKVKTKLKDIDILREHYVRVPENLIILDFDIKDPLTGEKNLQMNINKACVYPETYSELSKSGKGIHLHYWYDGDVSKLAKEIEPNVEIKVYTGKTSLRRKFTYCNSKEIAHISSGLPLKEDKLVLDNIENIVWTEKKLRSFIDDALQKKHHNATKPEVDFINKVLNDAKETGVQYDLTDLRQTIIRFAMSSSHNKDYCLKLVAKMPFTTIADEEDVSSAFNTVLVPDNKIVFFDIEVFQNVLIVAWKPYGEEGTIWINPTPGEIEVLFKKKLAGFNNRKYDNHILYNRLIGADNITMFEQSQKIIKNGSGMMQPAYGLSYMDLYEMADIKQSLKKWEIQLKQEGYLEKFKDDLGVDISQLEHDELEFDWDIPLDKKNWDRAGEYCMHDVIWSEVYFRSRYGQDAYTARKILSAVTSMSINSKTQTLAERFLFGDEKRPQDKFVWYDLAQEFPGYKFSFGKSEYLGKDPSEGGYVKSIPGVYENVGLLDVESLHPHSLIAINYFGPYTPRFKALVDCRMLIKHGKYDEASHAFDEVDPDLSAVLSEYLKDESSAKGLGHAMKIVINIIYGMTSASYDNKFRAPQNIDNIIAKRGALFMMTLDAELEKMGIQSVHIKTDSIKIPDMTQETKLFCMAFANKYGYTFDHEATFKRMALTNKAVLIGEESWPEEGKWEAVGTEFAMPYVFKRLFSKDKIELDDFGLLKSATSSIYLGDEFCGKNVRIYASLTGTDAYRVANDKKAFLTGTKGYKWKAFSNITKDDIDMSYYDKLVDDAVKHIYEVGDGDIMFAGTQWEQNYKPIEITDDELPL